MGGTLGFMSIAPNFTTVTLGVANLNKSIEFYLALGWVQRADPPADEGTIDIQD